jgi:hypothetical protein
MIMFSCVTTCSRIEREVGLATQLVQNMGVATAYGDMKNFSWSMGTTIQHESSTLRYFSYSDLGCNNGCDHSRVESDPHNSEQSLEYIVDKVGERQVSCMKTLGSVDGFMMFHINHRCYGNFGFPLHKKLEVSTKVIIWSFHFNYENWGFHNS